MTHLYRGWWVVVGTMLACLLAFGPTVYAFTLFLQPLATDFGWDAAKLGAAGSSFFFAAPLVPAVGYLIDRYGARPLLVAGGILEGSCFAAISQIDTAIELYVLRAIMGLGKICVIAGGTVLVTSWFDRRRGIALGIAYSGSHLGGVVTAQPTQMLLEAVGWRQASFVLGALLAVTIPLLGLLARDRRATDTEFFVIEAPPVAATDEPATDAGALGEPSGYTLPEMARTSLFWVFAAISLVYFIPYAGLLNLLPHFLAYSGFDADFSAWMVSTMAAMALVGVIGFGAACDRWHYRPLLATTFALMIVALSIGIVLPGSLSALGAGALVVAAGLSVGGADAVWVVMLRACYGDRSYGILFSCWYSITMLTMFGGPIIVGYAADQRSYEWAFAGLLVGVVLCLVFSLVSKLTPAPLVRARAVSQTLPSPGS